MTDILPDSSAASPIDEYLPSAEPLPPVEEPESTSAPIPGCHHPWEEEGKYPVEKLKLRGIIGSSALIELPSGRLEWMYAGYEQDDLKMLEVESEAVVITVEADTVRLTLPKN
jgi:hypothetical protein